MQIFIHKDDEVTLALAGDHRVASVNPSALLSRYAAGQIGPELLTVPDDAIGVTVRPLDAGELRAIKRKARPRDSSRGASIASRIQAASRKAMQDELKAAALAKRVPDTSVARDAVDDAEADLSEADRAALERHTSHRMAVIHAICDASILSIDLTGDGVTIADLVAEHMPAEAHRFGDAYPSQWVADKVLTATLSRWADDHAEGHDAQLTAAADAYRAALREVAGLGDSAAAVVAQADISAAVHALGVASGTAGDRSVDEAIEAARKVAGVDDECVAGMVRAAFAQGEAQRAAMWQGTINGAAIMAEVSTHIERLARLGKALAT